MINLRTFTEMHFDFSDRGYGKIADVVACVKGLGQTAAAITDCTTFGHIMWYKECEKAGIKPLLGVTLRVQTADNVARVTLIAKNNAGLEELYKLSSLAVSTVMEVDDNGAIRRQAGTLPLDALMKSSPNVIKLTGTLPIAWPRKKAGWYADISPSAPPDIIQQKLAGKLPIVATSDNRYPAVEDRQAFNLFGGATEPYPQHILTEREARGFLAKHKLPDSAYTLSDEIAASCNVTLPKASNMRVEGDLEKLCRANIGPRLGRWTKRYEARLALELKMIREKDFESYFLIIGDMVRWAKERMVVGPARGSAAGSLVCFLAYITDIDPLKYDLLFERFIDVTRSDLPDIDLDFPDTKRHLVIEYLQSKYGAANVVHLGTVLTFQPRSILKLVSKKLDIKMWEFQPLLDTMIERSSGDSRAAMCLLDTLEQMEAGRKILTAYPPVRFATQFEGHANTTGTHAAGIIVCSDEVRKYCTVDSVTSTAHIDKIDAEKINLLKIDVLGLRTLSVLEYAISLLPKRIDLTKIPLDDEKAFRVINDGRWAGIFQFEGDAVQMLTKQIVVDRFSDIVALGALARPGPLNSGGATDWANRRMGREETKHLHKLVEPYTDETYGIVVYQEQVMTIGREVGQLDWEDINQLRRAMSKSMGEEFFGRYYAKFLEGATKLGLNEKETRYIWDNLQTMGSWSFNKSHAVSYGLISYWCAWLKANHPLEFAAATLRHTKGEEQTVALLRELHLEGIRYRAFDLALSEENWTVKNGVLIGGFINLKGIGEKTAAEMVAARNGDGLTEKMREKIAEAECLYTDLFPAQTLYSAVYANPGLYIHGIDPKLYTARELDNMRATGKAPESFYFLGRLVDKVPRDLNEYVFQVRRMSEGKSKFHNKKDEPVPYLNVVIEDDTGRIYATIAWQDYNDVGKDIVDKGIVGKSWYWFKGRLNRIGRVNITFASDITNGAIPRARKGRAA